MKKYAANAAMSPEVRKYMQSAPEKATDLVRKVLKAKQEKSREPIVVGSLTLRTKPASAA